MLVKIKCELLHGGKVYVKSVEVDTANKLDAGKKLQLMARSLELTIHKLAGTMPEMNYKVV
jgi:hypothetical protein